MDKNKDSIKKIVYWLTEFEWEQFKLGNLFVRCRTEEAAKEFTYGCNLHVIELAYENETNWKICRENTVYHVINGFLNYCHIKYYNEHFSDIPIIEFKYNPTPICAFNNKKDNNKAKKEKYMTTNNSTNMDFKQAMRTWNRMCSSFADGCSPCPLYKATSGKRPCRDWVGKHPDEAITIFAKWIAENPEKTIMDDFFEKFPKAPRDNKGVPYVCAVDIGYSKPPFCCNQNANCCADCWQRPLEEVEE